ncbi:MAG: class I tRNA ligase family protein [Desulfobacterales bacterium]
MSPMYGRSPDQTTSAIGFPDGKNFKKFWPHARHIVAKDILKPHGIYWPIMLKAAGIDIFNSPRMFMATGTLTRAKCPNPWQRGGSPWSSNPNTARMRSASF